MTHFDFVPVYVDHYQSATYQLIGYTVDASGKVFAHFGDGHSRPSLYKSVADLLAAGERDYRERVKAVSE